MIFLLELECGYRAFENQVKTRNRGYAYPYLD